MGRPPRKPHGTAVPETPDFYGAYPRLTDEQIGPPAGHGRHQAVHAGQILISSQAPAERGPTRREDLERTVGGGRAWGAGRFRKALREAVRESRAQSLPDDVNAPTGRSAVPGEEGGTAANPREDGGDGR
jgi:hypothetical protein